MQVRRQPLGAPEKSILPKTKAGCRKASAADPPLGDRDGLELLFCPGRSPARRRRGGREGLCSASRRGVRVWLDLLAPDCCCPLLVGGVCFASESRPLAAARLKERPPVAAPYQ